MGDAPSDPQSPAPRDLASRDVAAPAKMQTAYPRLGVEHDEFDANAHMKIRLLAKQTGFTREKIKEVYNKCGRDYSSTAAMLTEAQARQLSMYTHWEIEECREVLERCFNNYD